jgi:hypothetical protein
LNPKPHHRERCREADLKTQNIDGILRERHHQRVKGNWGRRGRERVFLSGDLVKGERSQRFS